MEPNVHVFDSRLTVHREFVDWESALELLRKIHRDGIKPNRVLATNAMAINHDIIRLRI
jgi:hypothetical protein